MSFWVYILYSERSLKRYIGQTSDLGERIIQHNRGQNKSTKSGIPWKLYCYLEVKSLADALSLERKLKNLKSRLRQNQYFEKHGFIMQEVIGPEK
jgi:putative endonuclease